MDKQMLNLMPWRHLLILVAVLVICQEMFLHLGRRGKTYWISVGLCLALGLLIYTYYVPAYIGYDSANRIVRTLGAFYGYPLSALYLALRLARQQDFADRGESKTVLCIWALVLPWALFLIFFLGIVLL